MSYSTAFYSARRRSTLRAADAMLPCILEFAPAESLVDVGCGTADWLAAALEHDVKTVRGIDGPWVSKKDLQIDPELFTTADLSVGVPNVGSFDVAMSLEVGEHLPPSRAVEFVEELCALAPVVVFSAAIPGQGGLHHMNERWPGYWIEHFARSGYDVFDVLRPRIWNDKRIPYWYRQNAMIFVSRSERETAGRLSAHPSFNGADLVHPEHAERALQFPGVGALVRALPYAVARSCAGFGNKPPEGDG